MILTMNLQQFNELKEKMEGLKAEANRAEGALSQLRSQLKKEFDVGTFKEAEALLNKLEREEKTAEKEYESALKDFEEKWKGVQ